MGGCGCGDGFGDIRLPARDGGYYTLQPYYACQECDTPYGVILHYYKPGNDCPVEELCDEPEWRDHGDYATTEITFLHPQRLIDAVAARCNGVIKEIKAGDWDDVEPSGLAEAILDGALAEAVQKTTSKDW